MPPVTPHHPLFNCPTGDVSGSEEEGSEEGAGSDGGAAAAPGSWFAAGSDDEGGAPAVDLRRLEDLSEDEFSGAEEDVEDEERLLELGALLRWGEIFLSLGSLGIFLFLLFSFSFLSARPPPGCSDGPMRWLAGCGGAAAAASWHAGG